MTRFTCPVCFYPDMEDPPQDGNICPCCGTEFGNDDYAMTHEELRDEWIAEGMPWFFEDPPPGCSAKQQLAFGRDSGSEVQ